MTNPPKPDMPHRLGILPLLIAALLSACGDGHTLYHDYRPIPEKGWQLQDTVCFDFEVPDAVTHCRLVVGVRNRADYPYRNLSLAVCCTDTLDRMQFMDTVRLTLANEEGTWLGQGLSGLYQTERPLQKARLKGSGRYTVKIVSLLPDTLLHGINDIGIAVRK